MSPASAARLLLFLCTVPVAAQGPGFLLEFATVSPEAFSGVAGSQFSPFKVSAVLRPLRLEGPEGPWGWSIAVRHSPRSPILELAQVSIDGTNADGLLDRQGGFIHHEVIDPEKNGGQEGFLSTAVLSLERPVSLPSDRPSTIATATYRGVHPAVSEYTQTDLSFEFIDGLVGSDHPVVNKVSYREQTYVPQVQPLVRKLKTRPACNRGLSLDLAALGAVREEEAHHLRVELPAGQDLVVDVTATLSSSLSPSGPEGWSIAVKHDRPFFELLSSTAEGTDLLNYVHPEQRFILTEIVDGDEGAGFISAVVLSLEAPRTLPPVGEFKVARARYRLVAPHDRPGSIVATPIRYEDGLRGKNSQPVDNIITVDGKTEKACRQFPLLVEVNVVRGGKVFLRGDANNDSRVNVSDAVWATRWLFFNGSPPICSAALDLSGDFRLDLSDVIFLLVFLFQSGSPIPPPFPTCAPSPRLDDHLECHEAGVRCP